MLPVVHMLSSSDSMRANRKLLELLNAILQRGGVAVCETACLLGVIPAVLRFTEPHIPQGTRYEAARFIHTMCTRSVLTLQVSPLLPRFTTLNPCPPSMLPFTHYSPHYQTPIGSSTRCSSPVRACQPWSACFYHLLNRTSSCYIQSTL